MLTYDVLHIKTLSRESTLTTKLIMMMIDHQENFDRDDSQDRSAKRRGLVAHTTRPGKPESVEGEVKPLEDRMKSAESYYHPRDVDDGLSRNGGPEVDDSADPEPAKEKSKRMIKTMHSNGKAPR